MDTIVASITPTVQGDIAGRLQFAFALRSRFAEFGRTDGDAAFWRACFARMPLVRAMA
ncbi:hypothetical protein [Burkholderia ubonensis]|uniref:hypothetical protein n=1 Tax=Burkholderia ubonensis TaxID=101571 RepID=UPI0012F7B50E|nr:hypothetical protein [Burkholderia ubonensis]